MNLLTFFRSSFHVTISIIGIPASVDAAGIVGKDAEYMKQLVSAILRREKGLILCLNYDATGAVEKIINMQTLPTLIFEKKKDSWDDFLESIRHHYRRRIVKAQLKAKSMEKRIEPCHCFSEEHYNQYLGVMARTKEKLETLSFDFFCRLPDSYQLISHYQDEELLSWHITTSDASTYYYLFGGINYALRDKYDSYCNNLIAILQEGFEGACRTINLGQNATISKNRLGAAIIPLSMFLYHSNPVIRLFFSWLKNMLSYKIKEKAIHIYKYGK
jgi:hypothetical protein